MKDKKMIKASGILTLLLAFSTTIAFAQKSKSVSGAVLKADNFRHYVDYFNKMEDENIAQAVPNAQSWDWLKANIPLFECPQQNFEEMWYYRWWTLRKHLKQTPQGYIFTEFLVNRNYADKYNLIASALGHHIYEARWLRDNKYLTEYLNVWYRGNEGKAMKKLHGFSSWNINAMYNRYLVNRDSSVVNEYAARSGNRLCRLGNRKTVAQQAFLEYRCKGWHGRNHQRRPQGAERPPNHQQLYVW